MDNRDKLQVIATEVNNLLSIYIELHNWILKKQSGILSLFRKVPFERLYREASEMFVVWTVMHGEVDKLYNGIYDELSDAESEFLDCLSLYVVAVTKSAKVLSSNQYELYEVSKSSKNSKLTLKKVKENSKLYEQAIAEYQEIGEKLNKLNITIFG